VSPAAIVVAFDPQECLLPDLGQVVPGLGVDELLFVGREERLGDGVVEAGGTAAMERRTPLRVQKSANSLEVYWQPRSLWKMTPGGGFRVTSAAARASMIRLVRIWSAIAYPTTLRECKSITVAV
jgi:hypothetical protein